MRAEKAMDFSCRKLGQQVFIIVLDRPIWFSFGNELS